MFVVSSLFFFYRCTPLENPFLRSLASFFSVSSLFCIIRAARFGSEISRRRIALLPFFSSTSLVYLFFWYELFSLNFELIEMFLFCGV